MWRATSIDSSTRRVNRFFNLPNNAPSGQRMLMPVSKNYLGSLRRAVWIKAAEKGAKEQLRRQRSDFLADIDHHGQRADFYSVRHTPATRWGTLG